MSAVSAGLTIHTGVTHEICDHYIFTDFDDEFPCDTTTNAM